jgi:DNA-binding NtrC family response regulator
MRSRLVPGFRSIEVLWNILLDRAGDRMERTEPARRASRAHQVLVVDDEPGVGRAMRRLLTRVRVSCVIVDGAAAAKRALAEATADAPFTAVISDHRMPGQTGSELLRELRASHPRLLRVLMTGCFDEEQVVQAREDGTIELFLAKPWVDEDIEDLVGWIRDHQRTT